MIEIKFNFIKKEVWFSEKVDTINFIKLLDYKQIKEKSILYKSVSFDTILIDLNCSKEEIRKKFKQNYKNEISKAIKLNISFQEEKDFKDFKNFYNYFAKLKKLNLLTDVFNHYLPNVKITKAIYVDTVLVMHLYLIDYEIKKVRLLYSATSMSFDDKKIIGFANKFLHYEDMKFFKEIGFKVYDLGGINLDSEDRYIQGINTFKKGFGGVVSHEYNLTSYLLHLLRKIK